MTSKPSNYYLFYDAKLAANKYKNNLSEKKIIRYRRVLDKNNNPVDDLVIITQACKVEENESQEDFLKTFYEKKYNENNIYLGIGYHTGMWYVVRF